MNTQIIQKIEFLNSQCNRLIESAEKEINQYRKTPVSKSINLDLAFNIGRLHGVFELKILKELIDELTLEINNN